LMPDLEGGVTASGRPVLNLSFAINHALGVYNPAGYHVMNLAIHYLAALILFGIVRRTMGRAVPDMAGDRAFWMAASVSAIWMLHPLQTSAVTYLSQRAESLCGLFYLLTVYAFVRGTSSTRPVWWLGASIAACALGMGTKEVMVSAPILVLLYDRTFVAGSFADAWNQRRRYYSILAATWLLLVFLLVATSGRGTTAGFETVVSPWIYLLTQCGALVHYLRLAFWPHPLVFDYGTATVGSLGAVWWQALLLSCLAGACLWALVRRPVTGFLGAWFFCVLAPSSSFVPVASQTIAEHRMYLPLAAVIVGVVVAMARHIRSQRLFNTAVAVISLALGAATVARNGDYASEREIWEDTVDKMPANPRAHINLAMALTSAGNTAAALSQLDLALQAQPSSPDAHYNRAVLLSKIGRKVEAGAAYRSAIQFYPNHAEALNNYGSLLHEQGDLAGAETHYRRAIAARAGFGGAIENLSAVLLEMGRADEALLHAESAVDLDPRSAEAAFRLGNALLANGRAQDARRAFEVAVHLDPEHADARNNLGNLLVEMEQYEAALEHYLRVIDLRPEMIPPRRNAAIILAMLGRNAGAVEQFEALARIAPEDPFYREQMERLRGRP